MKSILILFYFILSVSSLHESFGQTVQSSELEIGATGSNQVTSYDPGTGAVPADYSGAFGADNLVLFPRSVAIGSSNTIFKSDSLAVGRNNTLGDTEFELYDGGGSLAVGQFNEVYGNSSVAIGSYNTIEGVGDGVDGAKDSLVVGQFNVSGGLSTMIVGDSNVIVGDNAEGHTRASVVVGKGLISKWNNSFIVGRYNDSDIEADSGLLMAIGNGTDSLTDRSNVFEIYQSGDVIMNYVQGDIPMGEFGILP